MHRNRNTANQPMTVAVPTADELGRAPDHRSAPITRAPATLNEVAQKRLACALRWAALGQYVVPVTAGSKRNSIRWKSLISNDPRVIERWITVEYPNCNFGLIMGRGYVCVDVDVRNGKVGMTSLGQLTHGDMSVFNQTFYVKTPSDGRHYYFLSDIATAKRNKAYQDIDFKVSGYITSPYSVTDEGMYEPLKDSFDEAIEIDPDIPAKLTHSYSAYGRCAPVSDVSSDQATADLSEEPLDAQASGELARYLEQTDPSLPYQQWVEVLFACLALYPNQDTVALVEQWSQRSRTKWDKKQFEATVGSFDQGRATKHPRRILARAMRFFPAATARLRLEVAEVDERQTREMSGAVLDRVVGMLGRRRITVSSSHRDALGCIADCMVRGLFTRTAFRKAFPLETGMGKTTLVAALCAELIERDIDKAVLIALEQREQLRNFHSQLVDLGVSVDRIAVFHSGAGENGLTPVRIDDAKRFNILLACHNGVRVGAVQEIRAQQLMEYIDGQGHLVSRNLVIWDESLIDAKVSYLPKSELLSAVATALALCDSALAEDRVWISEHQNAVEKLTEFLREAQERIVPERMGSFVVPAMPLSSDEFKPVLKHLRDNHRLGRGHEEALLVLFEWSKNQEIDAVTVGGEVVVCQYNATINEAFDKVAVLDASCLIRDLSLADPKLELERLPVTKSYQDVTIRWQEGRAGKGSFIGDQGTVHNEAVREQLLGLVRSEYPRDQELVIFHHKSNASYINETLKMVRDIRGVDGAPVHLLHFGLHRSSNDYRNAQRVFFWGVQYRDRLELAASLYAQFDRSVLTLSEDEVRSVLISEVAESIYQAMSRGNSRQLIDGRAGRQVIDLPMNRKDWIDVRPLLETVMPGVQVTETTNAASSTANGMRERKVLELVDAIAQYLSNVPADQSVVSSRKVRQAVLPNGTANDPVWRDAKDAIELVDGWTPSERGFEREPTEGSREQIAPTVPA